MATKKKEDISEEKSFSLFSIMELTHISPGQKLFLNKRFSIKEEKTYLEWIKIFKKEGINYKEIQ